MQFTRRAFMMAAAGAVAGAMDMQAAQGAQQGRQVMTVTGPVDPGALGLTLAHEHLLVDFVGADQVSRDRYDAEEVFDTVLPHLERFKSLGGDTLVECTPAWLGRDAELMVRLSESSGVKILTNTGYYGAADDRFVPDHAYAETAGQLAERWTAEWDKGIDGTSIRPGFIKIGLDPGPLSPIDRKLVEAAGHTHLNTGLTIAAHSGDAHAAREALKSLEDLGVSGEALIWVHAQLEQDPAEHARAAAAGMWVEFDGLGPNSVDAHVRFVKAMKERGHLDRVLVSHDAGWYNVGEPGGGEFRMFDTLFEAFLPALKDEGFSDNEVARLLRGNPAAAFTAQRRART